MAEHDFIKTTLNQRIPLDLECIMGAMGLAPHDDERVFAPGATPDALERLAVAALLLGDACDKRITLRNGKAPEDDFEAQARTVFFDLYSRLREMLPPDTATQHKQLIRNAFVERVAA